MTEKEKLHLLTRIEVPHEAKLVKRNELAVSLLGFFLVEQLFEVFKIFVIITIPCAKISI